MKFLNIFYLSFTQRNFPTHWSFSHNSHVKILFFSLPFLFILPHVTWWKEAFSSYDYTKIQWFLKLNFIHSRTQWFSIHAFSGTFHLLFLCQNSYIYNSFRIPEWELLLKKKKRKIFQNDGVHPKRPFLFYPHVVVRRMFIWQLSYPIFFHPHLKYAHLLGRMYAKK